MLTGIRITVTKLNMNTKKIS